MSLTELSKLNHSKHLAIWQQQVYSCRNSGTTVKAWCVQNGITEKSYYYRQRKVWEAAQQKTLNREALAQGSVSNAELPAVIPCTAPLVSVQHDLAGSSVSPSLVLRGKSWTVEVAAGCDPELLRLALRTVK